MPPVRAALLVLACEIACGDAHVAADVAAPRDGGGAASPAAATGDLLLARARLSIRDGVLAPEIEARILASEGPEHAHARRMLQALRDGVGASTGDADAIGVDPLAAAGAVPALTAPVGTSASTPTTTTTTTTTPAPASASAPAAASAAAPASAPARHATLERVAMQATSRGATLSLSATSGVLVGVVNQPATGIVRLVLDDVRAAPKVLSSRPGVTGARVRSIDASSGSVRITLALEPGWRFGGVRRTGKGASVTLLAPDAP